MSFIHVDPNQQTTSVCFGAVVQQKTKTTQIWSTYGSEGNGQGCGSSSSTGCRAESFVFGFLAHISEFNPEITQATRDIMFESCGRRFHMNEYRGDNFNSVSERIQNWLDAVGSVTEFCVRCRCWLLVRLGVNGGLVVGSPWWFHAGDGALIVGSSWC